MRVLAGCEGPVGLSSAADCEAFGDGGCLDHRDHPLCWNKDLPALLARMVGEAPDVVAALLAELVTSGAASIDDHGRISIAAWCRMPRRQQSGRGPAERAPWLQTHLGKQVGKGGGKPLGNDPGKLVGDGVGKTPASEDAFR